MFEIKSCAVNAFTNQHTTKKHEHSFHRRSYSSLLAGRPLSNPNTKIYIGARWIKINI